MSKSLSKATLLTIDQGAPPSAVHCFNHISCYVMVTDTNWQTFCKLFGGCFCSVAKSCLTLWPHELQHPRLPCPSLSPWFAQTHVHKSVMPSNHFILCHPLLLSSLILPSISVFSNESALCIDGGQSIGLHHSLLPMSIQVWFPLELTSLIPLQSNGLSRVSSSTTVQKH